ncbi:hypothetical protein AB6A40_008843 [Gnathostoma spinigerum]|uniref:Uncharacterized protein n=1 Tax=Gnathostoma spinigerum TaxID=75299 RepID=A0ABD6EVB8_9BILA
MRSAMHGAQSAAVTSASMGIGAAVVAVQLSVTLCIVGVNLVLSSVIKSKEVGSSAWERAKATELSIEKFLLDLVRRVYGITEGPVNVVIDHVHSMLDIANGLVNHAFGIESEPDPPECSVGRRAINLGSRVGETLSSRAHEEVIDPLCKHAKSITDQLSKSLDLADMIRERQAWALEKAEQINSSIADLKARLDEEAAKLNVNPEEILMNSVHQSSLQLANQLKQLKEKSHEVLTEAASLKLDAALAYVDKLQETVRGTKDVYQLKDDVLLEARSKLNELATWLSTLLIRDSTESP